MILEDMRRRFHSAPLLCEGGPGDPAEHTEDKGFLFMRIISKFNRATPNEGYTDDNFKLLEKVFRDNCGDKGEIGLEEFKKIIKSKNVFFAERMFRMFDTDNSGAISLEEFLAAMRRFSTLSAVEKMRLVFTIYDIDGDGLIQLSELTMVIKECMKENNLTFTEQETNALAFLLFHEADKDNSGAVNFEEFTEQLAKHPGLIENLSMSVEQWIMPPRRNQQTWFERNAPRKLSWKYMRNNSTSVLFLFLMLGILTALFTARLVQYSNTNIYFMIARGCAQCLNFLCTFVIVCVLRRTITIMRVHGWSEFLPLDQHIYYHKLAGLFIFFFSLLHTVMHILNFAYISRLTGIPFESMLIEPVYGIGWVGGAACITGWIMLAVLIIMVFSSLPCVRRNEYFEVFYYVHLLYFAFLILLILHGGNFWKWFLLPGTFFVLELLIRIYRFISPSTSVACIQKAVLLPSGVTHLTIKRPSHFVFHPGDYVFVNIPSVAKHEWHPFTISSAPEDDGVIWLHIRGMGNWTNSLFALFEKVILKASTKKTSIQIESTVENAGGITNAAFDHNENVESRNPIRAMSRRILQREHSVNFALTGTEAETTFQEGTYTLTAESEANLQSSPPETLRHGSVDSESDVPSSPPNSGNLSPPAVKMSLRHTKSSPDSIQQLPVDRNKRSSLTPFSSRSLRRVFSTSHRPSLSDIGQAFKRTRKKRSDEEPKRKRNVVVLKTGYYEEENRRQSVMARVPMGDSTELALDNKAVYWNNSVQIRLDGPYGSPSSHIFRAQHAVLIATGIGVTPFASILQSIVHRYRKSHHSCPWCHQTWLDQIPSNVMNLKKVDFFWINRNQEMFEWFVSLLSELEVEQAKMAEDSERFLDIHMYISSALHKTDMKALGLQIAMDLMHDKEKRDLITGLKTRTRPGRPNWDTVFQDIANQKKGKVTVFFCGPAPLGRELHNKCNERGFSFRKEIF